MNLTIVQRNHEVFALRWYSQKCEFEMLNSDICEIFERYAANVEKKIESLLACGCDDLT